jgi:hypothetical protein
VAGTIEHAYMGALAAHGKPLRGTNREGDHLTAAGALSQFGECVLDAPHIAVADDVISIIRHRLLLKVLVWDT